MTPSQEEVRKSAEEIVEEFVRLTQDLPAVEEQYYLGGSVNITRPDGEPTSSETRTEFRNRFLSTAPGSDEEGYIKVEVARWVEP